MNIKKKFIIFSILLGIIPSFVATSLYIMNLNSKSIEMLKQNLMMVANDQSIQLQSFFEQNINDLKSIASIPMTDQIMFELNNNISSESSRHNLDDIKQFLIGRKNGRTYLSKTLLVNSDGIVIQGNDNQELHKKIILSSTDMERLRENKAVVSSIISRRDFNSGITSAIIASPIFFKNVYQGSIISVIDMSYFEKFQENIKFFKTGKVLIMDSGGKIAYSSNLGIKHSISIFDISNDLKEKWNNIHFDKHQNGIIEYKVDGISQIGYYSKIKDSRWSVLSSIELNEFRSQIDEGIKAIIVVLLLVVLFVILVYSFIINYFLKPLFGMLESIKKIKHGNYSSRFTYNKNNELGEITRAFNELIDTIQKKKKHIEDKNRNLQSITSNMPGGVHRSVIRDGEFFWDFISSGCLNLFGYERYEFNKMFGKATFDIIYEKDRETTEREIKEQICKYNKYRVEYRIKSKDGSLIWLLDNGRIVKDRDGKTFCYSVAINITDTKIAQEQLRLSEERYRIIMSQTEDIIFEWNVKEDTISYSGNWVDKFNYKPTINNISRKIYKTSYIFKDDFKVISKLFNCLINGEQYVETEIRIKKDSDKYIWCKLRVTAIYDRNGDISSAIGLITDINKEKMEAEELLFKAQRDSLTMLYNKGTVQSIIEECINHSEINQINENHALFIMDIDDFKLINDNLGHLHGDLVLNNISSILLDTFGENAIVGRIGGDEFIVFLKNIESEKIIYDKVDHLMKSFNSRFMREDGKYKVSGSIGIARYPRDARCFDELFSKADEALYIAKKGGKNNYFVYQ